MNRNPRGEGFAVPSQTPKEKPEMLKRKFSAAIVTATLLACTAIVPVFADPLSPNGNGAQQDTMKNDKMGQDKMTGNKMSHRRRRHRRHKKHMAGAKMDKMQGSKKM